MDDFAPWGSGDAKPSASHPSPENQVRGLWSGLSVSQPWTLPSFQGLLPDPNALPEGVGENR